MAVIVLRAPGRALPLHVLLARAIEGADEALCGEWIAAGAVRVGGRPPRDARRPVRAGARVEVELETERAGLPAGVHPRPEPDFRAGGFLVLTAAPPWPRGELGRSPASVLGYAIRDTRAGVAELEIQAGGASAPDVLEALAQAGWPVLGDTRRGGIAVAGGARIRPFAPAGAEPPHDWWPGEAALERAPEDEHAPPDWRVSRATARALERGHPWILPDEESDDPGRFAPGTLVRVVDPRGRVLGDARIEGEGAVAARLWSPAPPGGEAGRRGRRGAAARATRAAGVEARVARALARREKLLHRSEGPHTTDALRLVHGEADGLPGLAVDRLGPLLRVLVSGRACAHLSARVATALARSLSDVLGDDPPILEVLHLRGAPAGRHVCVRWLAGEARAAAEHPDLAAGKGLVVHERGLCFRVEPGLAEPTRPRPGVGLFLDQRMNRERLARAARRGGRWLNLFAHTGAFSVALLAAGADEVVSVDLSAAYLRWLEQNLELNAAHGVERARHRSVRRDGRRYLDALEPGERFEGIVLDPPTAAAAGRRFWSAERELEPLAAGALARLSPGGWLLLCRNVRRPRGRLEAVAERAAARAGVTLAELREAGPGPDFPRLRGFAEGDAFQGVLARRA